MGASKDDSEGATRVLVVDDEAGVRDLLGRLLSHHGYEIELAVDAEAALEMMAAKRPDLVITDMIMPGMSGGQLLEQVRERYPSLPTMIITGNPRVESAVALIKKGAAEYIIKPFELQEILRKVAQVLADAKRRRRDAYVGTVFGMDLQEIGDYEVDGVLGEGANGVVFRATKKGESERGKWVVKALKLPGESNSVAREAALARFRSEGEIGEHLRHPAIVPIVDRGIAGEGAIPYLVMAYVEGKTLAQVLGGGALEAARGCRILVAVAEALAAVHEAGIVHRDLKPGNVMVGSDGKVTLMDFSIARVPDSDLTRAEMILGSPAYMAPEAFQGRGVDARADLFSLGVMGYEMLTGRRPFEGDTLARFAQVIPLEKPVRPSVVSAAVTPRLEEVLAGLMKKDPAARLGTAAAAAAAIREAIAAGGAGIARTGECEDWAAGD